MPIPQKIHYCWFGGNEKNELAKKCIASWKQYCPDYEIIEWNEDNFDVTCNEYCSQMFQEKKWAFLTDYVRLRVVYEFGGIYLDTDVELLKSLDDFLGLEAFMASEDGKYVNTGLGFGASTYHPVIKENMEYYEQLSGDIQPQKCPGITTEILEKYGYSNARSIAEVCGVKIYPREYFSPKDYYTERIHLTKNTVSIHHYSGSWCGKETAKQRFLRMHPTVNRIVHIPNRIGMFILGEKYGEFKSWCQKWGK